MSGASTIQFEKMAQVTGGDPAVMKEILGLFLRLAPESLGRLKQQLECQAWDGLAREAHKFRPSTMYVGLTTVYRNLGLVEETARTRPDAELLSRLVGDIVTECTSAFTELQSFREGLA